MFLGVFPHVAINCCEQSLGNLLQLTNRFQDKQIIQCICIDLEFRECFKFILTAFLLLKQNLG